MKWTRGKDGSKRLWFSPDEIEETMVLELTKANLMPGVSDPFVPVDTFVESYLRAQFDPYAPLPPTVLGETEFQRGAPPRVSINRDLTKVALDDDDSPLGILGRWRATVAHEAAHVLFHRCLFELESKQQSLFGGDREDDAIGGNLQRCLKRDVYFRASGGDWREVQANMGMAALLMPRPLFIKVCQDEIAQFPGQRVNQGSAELPALVQKIASRFKVSRQAASIRLDTLEMLSVPGQKNLLQS
jgi:hypothetical protein